MYTFQIKDEFSVIKDRNMIIVFFDGEQIEGKYNTKITRSDINNYNLKRKANNIFLNKDL